MQSFQLRLTITDDFYTFELLTLKNITMLTLNIKSVCKARGIDKPYTFLTKAGLSHHTATAILNPHTKVFKLGHIELICEKLHCTPNDLIKWEPDNNTMISPDHPLNSLKKNNEDYDWKENILKIPLDQLMEVANFIKNKK